VKQFFAMLSALLVAAAIIGITWDWWQSVEQRRADEDARAHMAAPRFTPAIKPRFNYDRAHVSPSP
jgi:hypothetical protein